MKRLAGILAAVLSLILPVRAQLPDNPAPKLQTKPTLLASGAPSQSDAPTDALSGATAAHAQPGDALSLYTVVDLALRNSHTVRMEEADAKRARGAYLETRDAYIPNFSIGSGLGYSYGFPIGGPTLYSINSNSLLFSFSQHDYIRSTGEALKAATLAVKNARQQVILDATTNYIELDKTDAQIAALNDAVTACDQMISIVGAREQAGLESHVELTRAQLTRARIELRAIQLQDHADELRQHLADLTGLEPDAIATAAASIPQLPTVDLHRLQQDGGNSPNVQAAFATARSRSFQALGDERQNYRPTVGMTFQYARFSTFNGYQQYYLSFQSNNIEVGIQAVWPLFDPIRRDKAMESRAESLRARQQAEQTKIQVDESNRALVHSLRELEAQEKVAELEQQLAQDTLQSTELQMNQGSASQGAAPIPPQEADSARVQERTSYVDLRDAQFNVARIKLSLLDAVGGLETWAKQSASNDGNSTTIVPQTVHPSGP